MKMLLASLLVLSFPVLAFIHGDDDRQDLSAIVDSHVVSWGKATATLISTSKIDRIEGPTSVFRGRPLNFFYKGLCPEVPFQNQPSIGHCSGMLVAPNLLLTAGHCIHSKYSRGPAKCPSKPWVFGYDDSSLGDKVVFYDRAYDYEEVFIEFHIPSENIYKCKKVIAFDYTIGALDSKYQDFALLELDRNVKGITPVPISSRKVIHGDEVLTFGYPLGLPVKLADNALVWSDYNNNYFTATLDAFQGNSGGAVINPEEGKVVGVVVRGVPDFISSPDGCRVPYRAFEHEALTKVQRIPHEVLEAVGLKRRSNRR